MTNRIHKMLFMACLALLTASSSAWAAAQLRLSDGVNTVLIVDETVGDGALGVPGVISYVGSVGPDWYLNFTTGLTKPLNGSAAAPFLDISTANTSSKAGALTIEFTDTDFTAIGAATANIGGNAIGTVSYNTYFSSANTPFAKTHVLTTLPNLSGNPFTGAANGVVLPPAPYSLTMEFLLSHPIAGKTGFDAELIITPVTPNCECRITPPAPICKGSSTPITVTAVGQAPFTYVWKTNGTVVTGANSATITASEAGTYEVTVTDANQCVSTCETTLTVNSVGCSITPKATICAGGSQTFTITPVGGTAPFTYLWNNGATADSITVGAAGTYTATVTDANGCSSTCETSLTLNPIPVCAITPERAAICLGGSQTFTASGSGGTAPYTYVWESGETTASITKNNAGTYKVTVTDANGCSSKCEATLTVNRVDCVITPETTICSGNSTVFTIAPDGGKAPFTYVWNTGATTPSITVSAPGTYTATVTDANGCSSTCTTKLNVNSLPTCSLTVPSPLPPCAWPGNELSGPAGMASYAWTIIASTGPGWAITGGANSQTVTYTTGSSGTATFQLVVTTSGAVPCTSTCQVTFGCAGDSGGCRVTGGSNKQLNSYQAACITTPLPTFVSHGGQVGASHSGETPFTPYSTCISGEWEHNRHLTQNSLVGTFHAAGNGSKHQYDSLLCACLPCSASPGALGFLAEICNPNNRICGPEPRRAPANKICFSGVGDYTYTTGRKTVKAVFRVDIEDRSEGNSHASTPPPDRYRIRIWLLDPACGRGYSADSAQGLALRYAVSADPTKIISLATTEDLKQPGVAGLPDIDDGGDMTQGNHQIHPETGSTCQ